MSTMASRITSLTTVYSTVYSGADQRKHQNSASLEGNSPVTGEFPAQRASNAENVSIWWRHHVYWDNWNPSSLSPRRQTVHTVHAQCHGWPGDARNQRNSRHCIGLVLHGWENYCVITALDWGSHSLDSDVTWASLLLKSPANRMFVQRLVQANNKRNITASWTGVGWRSCFLEKIV